MTGPILHDPTSAYFAADKLNPEAIASCFTPHAVVKDAGRTYSGLDAIRAWKAAASTKHAYGNAGRALDTSGRYADYERARRSSHSRLVGFLSGGRPNRRKSLI